jgi:hypothetical protein
MNLSPRRIGLLDDDRIIGGGLMKVLYNLVSESEDGIVAGDGEVIVSVSDVSGSSMLLKSKTNICGGDAWKVKLDGNSMSFEDACRSNKSGCYAKLKCYLNALLSTKISVMIMIRTLVRVA